MITPDYHFIYLDPALAADWLFVAARQYWIVFRPMVVSNLDLIEYVYRESMPMVAITVLARRDIAPKIKEQVAKRFPAAYYDPLVYDYPDEMKLTLDGRAEFQQRFGVPEPPPSATPVPLPQVPDVTPTYGAVIGPVE
ncbi:MAG: hypothetical protein U0528_11710 [Anaerolineae bacterium]|nr:hypothetical protein [Anaerolineae bacterium]